MSATNTNDAAKGTAIQPGQVGSHVVPSGPQTIHGHQPGRIAGEKDAAPAFSAQTLPAGSAPASKTFEPQTSHEVDALAETTGAADTLTGASSADVHTGLGHPGQGQSSSELHHDGGKTHRGGLQGVGAVGATSESDLGASSRDFSTSVPGATHKTTGENTPARGEDRTLHDGSA